MQSLSAAKKLLPGVLFLLLATMAPLLPCVAVTVEEIYGDHHRQVGEQCQRHGHGDGDDRQQLIFSRRDLQYFRVALELEGARAVL